MYKASPKDVEKALRFFTDTAIAFKVDDDGYVCIPDKEGLWAHYTVTIGSTPHELFVYTENLPKTGNVEILNPFSEGLGKNTPSQKFFYTALRVGLNTRIRELLMRTLKVIIRDKKLPLTDTKVPDVSPSKSVHLIVSGKTEQNKSIVDEIDEKMLQEFDNLLKQPEMLRGGLMDVIYRQTQRMAYADSLVLSRADYFDVFAPPMRKKTWYVFRAMLMNLMKVKSAQDVNDISAKATSEVKAPPNILTVLTVLMKIYERINVALEDICSGATELTDLEIDLGEFAIHLENIPAYADNARWMVNATVSNNTPQTRKSDKTIPFTTTQAHIPASNGPLLPDISKTQQQQAPQPPNWGATTTPMLPPNASSPAPAPNQGWFTPSSSWGGPQQPAQQPQVQHGPQITPYGASTGIRPNGGSGMGSWGSPNMAMNMGPNAGSFGMVPGQPFLWR